jgi:hypothetical protein
MTDNSALQAELERLRGEREAARLKLDIRQLQAAGGLPLVEAWGEVVDRREHLTDEPTFACGPVVSTVDDRRDGRFRPFYETELDLAILRGSARNLATLTAVTTGALDALANYVLGGGFTFTVRSAQAGAPHESLVATVQSVIDEFLDEHDFAGGFDRELHNRSREDGEAFVELALRPDGRVRARFLEPDQITEPANPRPLEDWLGIGDAFVSSWTFGIHTPVAQSDEPVGYHVVHDSRGADWDYIPAARLEHVKRNVTARAKRGVSDFVAIRGDLEREAKLRHNALASAALQAAVAWILQAPPGTTQAQVNAAENPAGKSSTISGLKTQNALHYGPGTILFPSSGLEYKAGPMGSERNSNFVLIAQYVLRSIGVRWNMPEYLISGDASNANYASALIAESPFVKAREADQRFYRRHFRNLIWKVLKLAWQAGRFTGLGVTWDALERQIEVKVDAPAVATRDPLLLAQTHETQIRLGILSRRTAAAQAGLDYDAEVQHGAGAEPVGNGDRNDPDPID